MNTKEIFCIKQGKMLWMIQHYFSQTSFYDYSFICLKKKAWKDFSNKIKSLLCEFLDLCSKFNISHNSWELEKEFFPIPVLQQLINTAK